MPIERGWFIKEKENEIIINVKIIKFWMISGQKIVYLKILILGINEE